MDRVSYRVFFCYDHVVTAVILTVILEVVKDLHSLRPMRGLVFLTSHFVITIS